MSAAMSQSGDESGESGESTGSDVKGPSSSRAQRLLGDVISDRYRVIEIIATGGMSTLYKGQHIHMRKHVAIKVLDAKAEKLPELVARFQREAIVGAHLQHPNIAQATDFGQVPDGSYFLVLEYVPGTPLNKVIAEGPQPTARAVRIARQIAAGLQAAHENGVVHRDVKPGNVMVVSAAGDLVKLIDFGFAKVRLSRVPSLSSVAGEPAPTEAVHTAVGIVLGTVAYMAPEAALGMPAVDERSDLYALGLIFYELLTGRHPFEATEPGELFMQQRTMLPPPMATHAPGVAVPPALEAVVMKLLEKVPEHRYQRAAELVSILDTVMLSMDSAGIPDIEQADQGSATPSIATTEPSPSAAAVASGAAPAAGASESAPSAAASRPLAQLADRATRRVSAMFESLPPDGRFPRWAYVGLPLIGLVALVVVLFLASQIPEKRQASTPSAAQGTPEPKPPKPSESQTRSETPPPPAIVSAASEAPKAPTPREPALDTSSLDAAGLRAQLRNAARQKDWGKGGDAVLALLRVEPRAFRDYDVANGARAVAVGLEQVGGEPAAHFFAALTNDAGQSGLDLLYDVSRFRPGSKAAKTALDILRRPDVMTKASPPLRVLVTLRETPCAGKKDWFAKVGDQGDDRALFELELLRDTECPRRSDPCCYKDNKALAAAIHALKSRLAPAAPAPP
jgi:serine/threonine-protein kinase